MGREPELAACCILEWAPVPPSPPSLLPSKDEGRPQHGLLRDGLEMPRGHAARHTIGAPFAC